MAVGSLYELVSQLYIARDNGLVNNRDFERLYTELQEISKMLSGLSKASLRTRLNDKR